jgi:phospholipid/cholesterol/gamma-HCH transport system substrate-binding protein
MGKEHEMKSDWLGRELTMEVIVGMFMLTVFIGLGYFTIILTRESWFAPQHPLEVRFKNVMGLKKEDSVVVNGMPVGKVKSLTLETERDKTSQVLVNVTLDQDIPIRKGYKITVVSTSILGGRQLQIDEGPQGNPPVPRGIPLEGEMPYDVMADAAETINAVKASLIQGGVITNLQSAVANLNEMIVRVNQGKGVLGKLLSEDDKLYNDLSASVASLKNISGSIDRGEGLLGKLIKDDKLYNKVESAIDEVRATVDDYRETAPVVTFTSLFFGSL